MTVADVLRDVKVADFSWIGVGPISSLWLSWHGATTVRLESTSRVDGIRFVHPFKDGVAGVNRGAYYACYNVNKLGITCNLNTDRGKEVARRLITWADIVVENFTPKAMRGWGLDYASIVEFKPDIIMLSASLQGQDGPEAMRPGFGNMLQGMAGFNEMIGWPDRGPSSVSTTYTDWLVPYFGATALTAALIHKEHTGEGQYIDLSQFEASLQFLGHAFLDGSVNGRVEGQVGNDLTAGGVRYVAPHGVYRTSGDDDSYVALAIFDDDQWSQLVKLAAIPGLTDERFRTMAGRCEFAREIDPLLERWTSSESARVVVDRLRAVGVPAGAVQTAADLASDPQLSHRGHFVTVPHTEIGEIIVEMPGARLSDAPARPFKAGACLGEDNEKVYQELLGYTEEEYYQLLAEGVVELWEH